MKVKRDCILGSLSVYLTEDMGTLVKEYLSINLSTIYNKIKINVISILQNSKSAKAELRTVDTTIGI